MTAGPRGTDSNDPSLSTRRHCGHQCQKLSPQGQCWPGLLLTLRSGTTVCPLNLPPASCHWTHGNPSSQRTCRILPAFALSSISACTISSSDSRQLSQICRTTKRARKQKRGKFSSIPVHRFGSFPFLTRSVSTVFSHSTSRSLEGLPLSRGFPTLASVTEAARASPVCK